MIILGKEKIRKKSIEIGLVQKKPDKYSFPPYSSYYASSSHLKRFSLKVLYSQLYQSFDVNLWSSTETTTPVQKTQ